MAYCHRCDDEVAASVQIRKDGTVGPACAICEGPVDAAVVNEYVSVAASPPRTIPPIPMASAVPGPKPPTFAPGANLVEMMSAELASVEVEIAHLRTRETYANQLRAMLAAAGVVSA